MIHFHSKSSYIVLFIPYKGIFIPFLVKPIKIISLQSKGIKEQIFQI